MTEPSFDPSGFFQFDLANGSVSAHGGPRVLMLSESVLAPLVRMAVEQNDLTSVRGLGSELGTLVGRSLGGQPGARSAIEVIGHAGGILSLFGWGRLRLEQWGDALVLHVEGLPPLDEDNLAVAALLGGMFSGLCSTEVACVPIGMTARYMMVDPEIAEQVWTWAKEGSGVAAIVDRLGVPQA
jgi:hypothetical protein